MCFIIYSGSPFSPEKWPFKRDGLSSEEEINTFLFRFTKSSGLSRGGGLSKGWPLKRGSTVITIDLECTFLLSSSTVFMFSIQTASTGPSNKIHFLSSFGLLAYSRNVLANTPEEGNRKYTNT